ncbi:MAG TPA: CarD family transcriptional regulator, partial [Clostridia bacterium]|nr:CarD family transcriptional regulator [Clostridia bacterium]
MSYDIFKRLTGSSEFGKLESCIRGRVTPCSVFGLPESAKAHMAAAIRNKLQRPVLFITYTEQRAEKTAQDLSYYLKTDVPVFPSQPNPLWQGIESNELSVSRARVLNNLLKGNPIAVASIESIMNPLCPRQMYENCRVTLAVGDRIELDDLTAFAQKAGYINAPVVETRGQFSLRGGIFDIFPPDADAPFRIELFDDEVDSIRTFSPETQRSQSKSDRVTLMPAREMVLNQDLRARTVDILKMQLNHYQKKRNSSLLQDRFAEIIEGVENGTFNNYVSLLPFIYEKPEHIWDYMSSPIIFIDEPKRVRERAEGVQLEFEESFKSMLEEGRVLPAQAKVMTEYSNMVASMSGLQIVTFMMLTAANPDFAPKAMFTFSAKAMMSFGGREEPFVKEVANYLEWGYTLAIIGGGIHKCKRIEQRLGEAGIHAGERLYIIPGEITGGFEYPDIKFAVIADQDIFGSHMAKVRKKTRSQRMAAFVDLAKGDFVVHETHGIGIYEGIVSLATDGVQKDYLSIRYNGTDRLYVPVENMDVVQKYIGVSEHPPSLSRLGGQEWNNTKRKVK